VVVGVLVVCLVCVLCFCLLFFVFFNINLLNPVIMLTPEQIDLVSKKINEFIDLPILGEKLEFVLFKFVIKQLDKVLDKIIPEEIQHFIQEFSSGIEATAAPELKGRIKDFMLSEINIPLIGKKTEAVIEGIFVDILVDALTKNNNIGNAINNYKYNG
jgi:hypothetical protein